MSVELEDRGQALENEYFRRKEQELIAKMKAKINADGAQASELQCPKCDGKLVETNFEKITIDVCNSCSGVWLDAGELAQVVDKEEKGGGWLGKFLGK
jgi:ribosomal protein L37AE/L43A